MEKKWLITLGTLTLAAATTATVGAFILTSSPSAAEGPESVGVQEPAYGGTEPPFDSRPDGAGATTGNPDGGVGIVRDDGSTFEVPIGRFDQDGPKDDTDKAGQVPTVDPVPEPLVPTDEDEPAMGMPVPGYTGTETLVVVEEFDILQPKPLPPFEYMKVFQLAQDELSQRLGINKETIKLTAAEELTWSDTSLGIAEPGMAYAQVLVPGFKLALVTPGNPTLFLYHASKERVVFFEALEAARYEERQLTHGDPGPTGGTHGKVVPPDKLEEVPYSDTTGSNGSKIAVEPMPVPAPNPAFQVGSGSTSSGEGVTG